MRASDIYMDLACLELEKLNLTPEEHLELLKGCDMKEIDEKIHIASPLQSAIDGIIEGLMDERGARVDFDYLVDLSDERLRLEMDGEVYKNYLVFYEENRGDFPKKILAFRESIGNKDEEEEVFSEIMLTSLEEMHNHWVRVSTNLFFDENLRDRQFMFMPFYMIGWEEVERYFDILWPIIEDLELDDICTKRKAFSAYVARSRRLQARWDVDIARKRVLEARNCSPIIQKAIKKDMATQNRIAKQVYDRITQA